MKEKKIAFKRWRKSGLEADRKEYNTKKKEAKRIVAVAKKEGTAILYEELDTRRGKDIQNYEGKTERKRRCR